VALAWSYTNQMSDVRTFNPDPKGTLDERQIKCIRKGASNLEVEDFGFNDSEKVLLMEVMLIGGDAWETHAKTALVTELIEWIRFFTLLEKRLLGFETGPKSPVIALARALRKRGEYPDDLTAWIKVNTDNRFLPHGSLMDRL